jgi:FAD/FMN-containing dehydrogenase
MTISTDRLPDALRGFVVAPGDPGYDEARPVWNARIDARPALIARPPDVDAVADALRLGRESGLPIAVRGGGHSVAGHGTVDGGLVIDLAGVDSIAVDPVARTARVGGGVKWGALDAALASHGLATVGGQISTTGVGGLTLGGGVGWLMGAFGLVVDNLREVDLIDAEGRRRTVSQQTDPDLFWALRGGGGNFGIATEFEFDLHPVRNVLAGTLLHPFDRAPEVIARFRDLSAVAPDELTLMVLLLQAPRQPFIPEEHRGRPVALFAVCWLGDPDRGAEVLRPITSYGPALVDSIRVMPYPELQSMFDHGSRPGFGNAWRSPFLRSLDDAAIATIVDYAARMPTDISQVLLTNMGGAVARVPDAATAFPQRRAPFYLEVIAKWEAVDDGGPVTAWADEFDAAIRPWSTGYTYVNFLDEHGGRPVGAAYDPATLQRLAELKRGHDPDNVFRVNHNVPPAP